MEAAAAEGASNRIPRCKPASCRQSCREASWTGLRRTPASDGVSSEPDHAGALKKTADEKLVTSYHGISQRLFKIENRQPSAGADSRFLNVQKSRSAKSTLRDTAEPVWTVELSRFDRI